MRSLFDQSIAHSRLGLAFINLAVLLGVAGVLYRSNQQFLRTIEYQVATQHRIASLHKILLLVTDVETGQRGFILTGEDRFLAPYEAAVTVLPDQIEDLRKLLDEPAQVQRMNQLQPLVIKRMTYATDSIALYQIKPDLQQQIARSDRGRELQDQIRQLVAEMQTVEQRHLEDLEGRASHQATTTSVIFLSGFSLSLLIFLLVYYLLNRQIKEREQAEVALQGVNRSLRTLSACNQTLIRATEKTSFMQEICERIVTVGNYVHARIEVSESGGESARVEAGYPSEHGVSLSIPLMQSDRAIGSLIICSTDANAFNPDAVILLEELADDVAYGLAVLHARELHQQTEVALVQSEQQLRLALESAQLGIWNWNLSTQKIEWTEGHARIFGMELADFDGRYETFATRVHPDDLDLLNFKVARALQEQTSYTHEYRIVWSDGSVHWVEGRGRAFYDASGQPLRMAGTVLDISDRKLAELALQQSKAELEQRVAERTLALSQSNEQLADLYNNAPCGYHSLDENGTFIHINDTELQWLGYSRDEVVHRMKFTDLLTPEGKRVFYNCFPQFKEQGWISNLEFDLICRNGSTLPIVLSATAIKDADGRFMMSRSTMMDVRDRKQAEANLRESEERFRRAFEDAAIGMVLVNLTGRFLQVNQSFCEMTGYSEAELLTMTVERLICPEEFDRQREVWQQLLNHELSTLELEQRYLHKQGHAYWVKLSASLVRDSVGQPLYVIAQIQDVTEQRAVEQMKNEFISIVSHELRTPLTSIHGAVSLLASGLLVNRPDRANRMLEIAALDTERLVRLVNDILDLERLDSGRTPLSLAWWDVASLMQQSIEGLQSLADAANVRLVLEVPTTPVRFCVDRDRIIQTLTNLISNAIKFSPAGGTVWLVAEINAAKHELLFSVQDQGRGIPVDKLEAIFGRFQQVDVSDSRLKGGTGLGLAICRTIVQQHGGKIWAESTIGEGSTFYVALPLPEPENLSN